MGTHITFRRCTPPETVRGSMLFDDEEFVEELGIAYFSAFTESSQRHFYGISYLDCLTYGEDGPATELLGAPDTPEGDCSGWYTPNWPRALLRVQQLQAAWEQTDCEGRKVYDAEKLPIFVELIRRCAEDSSGACCQVSLSF